MLKSNIDFGVAGTGIECKQSPFSTLSTKECSTIRRLHCSSVLLGLRFVVSSRAIERLQDLIARGCLRSQLRVVSSLLARGVLGFRIQRNCRVKFFNVILHSHADFMWNQTVCSQFPSNSLSMVDQVVHHLQWTKFHCNLRRKQGKGSKYETDEVHNLGSYDLKTDRSIHKYWTPHFHTTVALCSSLFFVISYRVFNSFVK